MKQYFSANTPRTLHTALAFPPICASLLGFLDRLWWVFELASHFRVQYLAALGFIGLVALAFRQYVVAGSTILVALINLACILPLYAAPNDQVALEENRPVYSVLLANVYTPNRAYNLLRHVVERERPDIVVLQEIDSRWRAELGFLRQAYRFHREVIREDNFGMGLYARVPVLQCSTVLAADIRTPSLFCTLDLGGDTVRMLATHPPPPKGPVDVWPRRVLNLQGRANREDMLCARWWGRSGCHLRTPPWGATPLQSSQDGIVVETSATRGGQETAGRPRSQRAVPMRERVETQQAVHNAHHPKLGRVRCGSHLVPCRPTTGTIVSAARETARPAPCGPPNRPFLPKNEALLRIVAHLSMGAMPAELIFALRHGQAPLSLTHEMHPGSLTGRGAGDVYITFT